MTEESTKQKPVKLTHQEKLEKLKKQEAQLKARIQMMENIANEEKRKKENRLKFLLGAFLLDELNKDKEKHASLFEAFKQFLTRERDKNLLDEFFDENSK